MKQKILSKLNYNYLSVILALLVVVILLTNINSMTGRVTQDDCSCVSSDVNRDKILDVNDLNIIVDCINNKASCQPGIADVNKDNIVSNLDFWDSYCVWM